MLLALVLKQILLKFKEIWKDGYRDKDVAKIC